MNKKAILYRLASWPNLTQLTFMYSIPFGGLAWLQACEANWPMQNTPMCAASRARRRSRAASLDRAGRRQRQRWRGVRRLRPVRLWRQEHHARR